MAPVNKTKIFDIVGQLGSGGFGQVLKVVYRNAKVEDHQMGCESEPQLLAAKLQEVQSELGHCIAQKELDLLRNACPRFFPKLFHSFVIDWGKEKIKNNVLIMELGIGEEDKNINIDKISFLHHVFPHVTGTLEDLVLHNIEPPKYLLLWILRRVADALEYLHFECNLVHGDVKPGNILLNSKLVPLICDLGATVKIPAEAYENLVTIKFEYFFKFNR